MQRHGSTPLRHGGVRRGVEREVGLDVKYRRPIHNVSTAEVERDAVHLEKPCDAQTDRVGSVRRTRCEETNGGAAERWRVDLGTDLQLRLLLGRVRVFVELVYQPNVREALETLERFGLHARRVEAEHSSGCGS